MQSLKLMRDVWELFWPQIVQVIAIFVMMSIFIYLGNFSILVFVLIILSTSLIVKLGKEMAVGDKPSFKDWIIVTIPRNLVLTSAFILALVWLGALGVIGYILIFVLLAATRIVFGWKLYSTVTSWGAAKIKGYEGDIDIKKDARYYDDKRKRLNEQS